MHRLTQLPSRKLLGLALFGIGMLGWCVPARCQMQSGGGFGGNSSSGGVGSSISGGSGGSSISGGFGGSSGGTSFSGGSFGGSVSGSSGSGFGKSNSTGFGTTGANFNRTTVGLGYGSSSLTNYSVSTSNAFGTYYANPLAAGLPGGTGRLTFGTPLYTISTTTSGSTSGIIGSLSGSTGMQGGFSSSGSASTSSGVGQLLVNYSSAVTFPQPMSVSFSGKVLNEVRGVLMRSSALPSKNQIRAQLEDGTVVLRGTVSDDHERRLAASLVGLTPGVHDVRNELQVQGGTFMPLTP